MLKRGAIIPTMLHRQRELAGEFDSRRAAPFFQGVPNSRGEMAQRPFPFVGVTSGILDGKHMSAMGESIWLFMFLIQKQTSPDGRIFYGRPVTYSWIREQLGDPRLKTTPCARKIQRWMQTLRLGSYVDVQYVWRRGAIEGMVLKILRPKKWANQSEFSFVNKPVEKLFDSPTPLSTDLSRGSRQKWPSKDLSLKERTRKLLPPGTSTGGADLTRQIAKIQRLNREADAIRGAFAGSRESADRDAKLMRIAEQLEEAYGAIEEREIYNREVTA